MHTLLSGFKSVSPAGIIISHHSAPRFRRLLDRTITAKFGRRLYLDLPRGSRPSGRDGIIRTDFVGEPRGDAKKTQIVIWDFRAHDLPKKRIDELMPWHWIPRQSPSIVGIT
jgi:hypothetical protein